MTTYPDKGLTVETLAEVAAAAGHESLSGHPDDVATAMVNAIEGAAVAIEVLWKRGVL